MVDGTDGLDFMHRQKVANQYKLSAVNKSRLKTCIFFHILLFFVMLLKLTPVFLDKLDIFVLEIEELRIPKPMFWEYWWCFSIVVTFVGLSAIRKNNSQTMQFYLGGITANAIVPVLFAMYYYSADVYKYATTRSSKNLQTFMGYPYGVLWYVFLLLALQVHLFTMYFASKLLTAWQLKGVGSQSTASSSAAKNNKMH
jgi:hypothetical protein